ncbi:oxidoreductase [Marinobacterium jannaschii]|uniref:oxidoreductase n=1 Tax=Marinobacterium jannaschii TaxID=64970 RepID=UPI00047F256E|nr:NADH:flavin oxidoreductase [Marinobacterium jannaschii]
MTTAFSALFEPGRIGHLNLRNRLAVAPMTRVSANDDGTATVPMRDYYQQYAKGGFSMIISEGLYTDQLYSQCYQQQPGISSPEQADSWSAIVDAVHAKGSVIIAQLMHGGALSQFNKYRSEGPHSAGYGPSAVQPLGEQMKNYYGSGTYPVPTAMTPQDIRDAVQGFADAAARAKSAGFDGVEIHGANGYLLDQFLTNYTNQRDDKYGGDLKNRLRIYLEIIDAVRKAVGPEFVVGVRFSQTKVNDSRYSWPEQLEAAEEIFGAMRIAEVDYLHTTEPLLTRPAFQADSTAPDGPSLATLAKQASGLPVIANGGVSKPELAETVLADGQADLIALGTAALANPLWPQSVLNNKALKTFDYAMLSPIANLECADRYFAAAD